MSDSKRHDLAVDTDDRAECLCGWTVNTGSRPANLELLSRHIKLARSGEYGRENPRTEDFQLTELFGWYDGIPAGPRIITCKECGGAVSYDPSAMNQHRRWHNKLLP